MHFNVNELCTAMFTELCTAMLTELFNELCTVFVLDCFPNFVLQVAVLDEPVLLELVGLLLALLHRLRRPGGLRRGPTGRLYHATV